MKAVSSKAELFFTLTLILLSLFAPLAFMLALLDKAGWCRGTPFEKTCYASAAYFTVIVILVFLGLLLALILSRTGQCTRRL